MESYMWMFSFLQKQQVTSEGIWGDRRRQWQPTPVLLLGKSHGQRSLVGGSPWGRKERLHFHFSLSYIGEGNGNPLQCSCLESPRDGGAWWAAVCGVAQSWTRLKRLSRSSFQRLVNIKKVGGFIDWLHNFWWFALIGLGTDIKCSEIDSAQNF